MHAASLIHDDIIDQSMFRRGNVTVPQKWGNKVSVLAGDFMYSVALNLAISDGNPAIFPLMVNGTKDMVMGELCQLEYADITTASREHYLTIIELKTARFMGSCAKLGATKSGLDRAETEQLYRFGLNLGFAFQIIDDTLDIMQNADHIGKDAGSDFKDGKITLPFLYLIETGGPEALKTLKRYIAGPEPALWQSIVRQPRRFRRHRLLGAICGRIHQSGPGNPRAIPRFTIQENPLRAVRFSPGPDLLIVQAWRESSRR